MLKGIRLQDEALPFTSFEFRVSKGEGSFWGSEATMLMKTLGRNKSHGSKATMSMKVKALVSRTTMSLMGKGLVRMRLTGECSKRSEDVRSAGSLTPERVRVRKPAATGLGTED